MEISAVIFDMDGLMLDTESINRLAWQKACSDWGYVVSDDIYHGAIGRTIYDTKKIFLEIFGPNFPFDEIHKKEHHYYKIHVAQYGISIKPGLPELLDFIDTLSICTGVASSTRKKTVLQKLYQKNLLQRFDVVIGGDEIQKGKPAPDIYLAMSKMLNTQVNQCLVLEDSEAGIKAAYQAGMVPIMVPDLKQPSNEIAALTYKIFPSLNEVKHFLSIQKRIFL